VSVLNIPVLSTQERVILCSPGSKFSGGLHFHAPELGIVNSSLMSSDSTVILIEFPDGPFPKNSGSFVNIISLSSMLSRVTELVSSSFSTSGTTNFDSISFSVSSGRFICDAGISSWGFPVSDLKSWIFPRVIGGVGFAAFK